MEIKDLIMKLRAVDEIHDLLPFIKKELKILDDNSDEQLIEILERAHEIGYQEGQDAIYEESPDY